MKNVILLIFAGCLIAGCSKNPVAPLAPSNGQISGTVVLFNENGDSVLSSGVNVSVNGINSTAQTDAYGKWSLKAPKGSYVLSFAKEGYGPMKAFDITTNGNDSISVDEIDMSVASTEHLNFQMLRVSELPDSTPFYFIQGKMEQKMETRSIALFLSTDSASLAADPNSAQVSMPFTATGDYYEGAFTWNSTTAFGTQSNPFAHGTKVYATICIYGSGSSSQTFSNYFDPNLNKQVYTALGPHSQIIRQIIP